MIIAILISSFRPLIPCACSAPSSWRNQEDVWSAGALQSGIPASGVVLSLTCIRTAIPASWQACSQAATCRGSPSRRVTCPAALHSCRQVVPSRRIT
ncbi:hypothetical protein DP199_02935 [Enterobacter kobei]|nr:hypothetical protein DP199_02935 [Enterobacter kobei]